MFDKWDKIAMSLRIYRDCACGAGICAGHSIIADALRKYGETMIMNRRLTWHSMPIVFDCEKCGLPKITKICLCKKKGASMKKPVKKKKKKSKK